MSTLNLEPADHAALERIARRSPKADPLRLLPEVPPRALPRHVAVIMDGNGRWAQERGFPREFGHRAGAASVRAVTEAAVGLGLDVLTLYSFSMENWKRPRAEVEALMQLCQTYLDGEREHLMREGLRFKVIGRREGLPEAIVERIEGLERLTAGNPGLTLCLAINYGGRAEIADAARAIARDVAAGRMKVEAVDEAAVASRLTTADLGPLAEVDLLVRTAGELRVSNFLLWQISYAEIHISPVFWPEFGHEAFKAAVRDYASRRRRFGGLDAGAGVAGAR